MKTFDNAHGWLQHAVNSGKVGSGQLLNLIAEKLSGDDIQDEFQSLMEADGYFVPHDKINHLPRERLVKILEDHGFDCYDKETDNELREAIAQNIVDGDIPVEAIEVED